MNCIILSTSDFIDDDLVRITGRRFSHCKTFFDLTPGKKLQVGLLGGYIGQGVVKEATSESVCLSVRLTHAPPQPSPITLVLALPRPKSLRKSLHAAVTFGVKEIYLIKSWRVDKSYWQTPLLQEDRLDEICRLGLEQTVDTIMPRIHIRKRFKPFVEDELPLVIQGKKALVAHPAGKNDCPSRINVSTVIAVGPEGGFISYEVDLFEKKGFSTITMGSRILRVEEAICALLGKGLS